MYLIDEMKMIPPSEIVPVWIQLNKNMNSTSNSDEDGDFSWSGVGHPDISPDGYVNQPDHAQGYEAFPVWSPEGIKSGDLVYVLWCVYSTGDSFGHSYGNSEILMVYKDPTMAKTALDIWLQAERDKPENDYMYAVLTPFTDTVSVKVSNPGAGYFEDLTDVRLDLVRVL